MLGTQFTSTLWLAIAKMHAFPMVGLHTSALSVWPWIHAAPSPTSSMCKPLLMQAIIAAPCVDSPAAGAGLVPEEAQGAAGSVAARSVPCDAFRLRGGAGCCWQPPGAGKWEQLVGQGCKGQQRASSESDQGEALLPVYGNRPEACQGSRSRGSWLRPGIGLLLGKCAFCRILAEDVILFPTDLQA